MKYRRAFSFRIVTAPAAGQLIVLQIGPMADGSYLGATINYAVAVPDVHAAAVVAANAIRALGYVGVEAFAVGDGIVEVVIDDGNTPITFSRTGTVACFDHMSRVLAAEPTLTRVVTLQETKADPVACLISAGVGMVLGKALH